MKVDNESVLNAMKLLAREGIFAQPASATCLAGLIEAVNRNVIPVDSIAAMVVTGTGLKYPPVLKKFDFAPISIELDNLSRSLSLEFGK